MIKIYYMTGTGNSLKIAKDIGMKLGDHQLISMPHLPNTYQDIFIEGDIIGFVVPVYFGRPPVFFRNLSERPTSGRFHIFLQLLTEADCSAELSILLRDCLREKDKG